MQSVNSTKVPHRSYGEQPDHFQLNVGPRAPPPPRATEQVQWEVEDKLTENGHRLTLEQEQSADELIADIQRSVDEMLLGFQSPIVSPEPPSPAAKVSQVSLRVCTPRAVLRLFVLQQIKAGERNELVTIGQTAEKVGLTLAMKSINGGFGFRIIGGRDMNAVMIPQVDLVAPGMCTCTSESVCLCERTTQLTSLFVDALTVGCSVVPVASLTVELYTVYSVAHCWSCMRTNGRMQYTILSLLNGSLCTANDDYCNG